MLKTPDEVQINPLVSPSLGGFLKLGDTPLFLKVTGLGRKHPAFLLGSSLIFGPMIITANSYRFQA